ncbi:MAG: aminopeptidase P family protein, partial [Anaerolineae bacterium]
MSDFEIIHEKLDQAVQVLAEKDIDLWITFVRETSHIGDPCLALLLGLDLTWQSALMISRTGERIAIVGRFDVDSVERVGGYATVVGYDQSIREPLLEHLTRLNPRQIALNFSENDSAADGLTHGMFRVLTKIVADTEYANRLISAEGVIGALRGRKTPAEVSRIRAAVQETDVIFQRVGQLIRPGVTAREIACWFH